MTIVEEAVSAGIEEIAVIVQKDDLELFQDFFCSPPTIENFNKLSKENQRYSEYLMELGHKITFLKQEAQEGFGHAVYCARQWVNNEPFLLLLGDHLYGSSGEDSCAKQMVDLYQREGCSVLSLEVTAAERVHNFGCVSGIWKERGSVLSITEFCEKPDLDYARGHLHVDGMEKDKFLCVFGLYVLTPRVFDFLEEHLSHNIRERGEFQLTSCLDRVRQYDGFTGYVVQGRRFDIGLPDSYRQTVQDFRAA